MKYVCVLALAIVRTLSAATPTDPATQREGAWKILDESLNETNYEHRQQALAALSTLGRGDEDGVRRAESALHDKDPVVRCSAAIALGEMKALSALPYLKEALDDTPEVSFAAAKALTQLGDTSGRDILIAVLAGDRKDTPGMMTSAMRDARDKLHHPEGLFLMGSEDAMGAMFGPASMVIPAIKDTTDLKGKGAPGKAAAVAYLAKYPDPYAVQLLEWALIDDNQFVRLEAARALGERGNAGSIDKLEGLYWDKHNVVRDMAAASILRILARGGEAGAISPGPVSQPKTDRDKP